LAVCRPLTKMMVPPSPLDYMLAQQAMDLTTPPRTLSKHWRGNNPLRTPPTLVMVEIKQPHSLYNRPAITSKTHVVLADWWLLVPLVGLW
jgi:hypothetical protein